MCSIFLCCGPAICSEIAVDKDLHTVNIKVRVEVFLKEFYRAVFKHNGIQVFFM